MVSKFKINISKRFMTMLILFSIGVSVECFVLIKNPIYSDMDTYCDSMNITNITYPQYNDKCNGLRFDTCYYDNNKCMSIEINYPRYRSSACYNLINIMNEFNKIKNSTQFRCYINGHYGYVEPYQNLESTKYIIISWSMVGVAFSCFIFYGLCEYYNKRNNYIRIN